MFPPPGQEISQHPRVIDLLENMHVGVNQSTNVIRLFPSATLGRLVVPFVVDISRHRQTMAEIILPEIQQRCNDAANNPDFKPPDDLMQIFCNAVKAQGNKDTPEVICKKLVSTVLASVAVTVHHAVHFVYDIASYPLVRKRIFEEQQQIIARYGTVFSKEAVQDMVYLDACLHESLRLNVSIIATFRKALCDTEFSNGMQIPKGRICFINANQVNCEDSTYQNTGNEYLPERWLATPNVHSYSVSPSFSTFGYGRHACPGRYYAASQLKTMMAWLVRSFDLTTQSGRRPLNIYRALEYTPIAEPIIFTPRDLN
jgi:cytochrome P450